MDRFENMDRVQLLREVRQLDQLVNTPELVDFAKGVHLEAVHQELRWGTSDRKGKTPYDWHWLVAHLAGRALEHHKEAERLEHQPRPSVSSFRPSIAYHREKAVHHCVTAAAAIAHWHASVLGKHTSMQPGHGPAIADAMPDELQHHGYTTSGAIGQP